MAIAFAASCVACERTDVEVLSPAPPRPDGGAGTGGSASVPPPSRFLERDGSGLSFAGEPYRFVGFDAFTLTGCSGNGGIPDDAALDTFFGALRPRSVVRTYAFQPQGLPAVERVVASARKWSQMLVLVLTDHAGSCGEGEADKTTAWYQGGYSETYLPWLRTVVSRFADEPAVAMWEPVKAPVDVAPETLRGFYDAAGGEIHRLDGNHLVEAGIHGPWAYGGESGYQQIVKSPGIDVASFHDYDNVDDAPPNLEASARAALATGKPVILVELGLYGGKAADPADIFGPQKCIDWNARRDNARSKLQASLAASVSGVLFWNWSSSASTACGFGIADGDPLFDLVRAYVPPRIVTNDAGP